MRIILCNTLLALGLGVCAQDLHFSQYFYTPSVLNPALVGAFEGDLRASVFYRHQWQAVPVPYMSANINVEGKIAPKSRKEFMGVGASLVYDQAGSSKLTNTGILFNLSYIRQVWRKHLLSAGFQGGVMQRGFSREGLTFDNQFSGDIYDPNRPTGENFNKLSFLYGDMSMGLSWTWLPTKRKYLRTGVGLYHLLEPSYGFRRDALITLPRRWVTFAEASIPVGSKSDVVPSTMFQYQGKYSEWIFGLQYRHHLNQKRGAETALLFGTSYRLGDAVVFNAGLHLQQWKFGVSYDVNTSPFSQATLGRGGVEFAAVYTYAKVRRLPTRVICPVF